MIYKKLDVQEKINSFKLKNIYVVSDFDRTLTAHSCKGSWSILKDSNKVPKEYGKEAQAQYDYYRPIEINNNLDFEFQNNAMIEWWKKHISLFTKYKMSEEVIKNAVKDLNVMEFRAGTKEFLELMNKANVPVIIMSAGVGNFIEQFLKINNCYFNNIHIISNFIEFKNGIASGVSKMIIHSLNKNEISLPEKIQNQIKKRNQIILMGDILSDIKMVSEAKRDNTIRIAFLEENVEKNLEAFKKEYDLVCTDNTSIKEVMDILNLK